MKYPKHTYERDPEVLHLYVKDIRILTPKEYNALKTVLLQKILILKQNLSFTSKNIKKQNISQITSKFKQLFQIIGL